MLLEKLYINEKRWPVHVLFWLLYSTFWLVVSSPDPFTTESITINSIFLAFNAIPAYANIYYLIPRLASHKKYILYFLLLIIITASSALLLSFALYHIPIFSNIELSFIEFSKNPRILSSVLGSVISSLIIVTGIKLLKQYLRLQQQNQEIEKIAMTTELKFLRSQLDPHFMFNALNNIYFLIKKDPDVAAEYLAQYSDIMKYQLYKSNESKIPLGEEIQFIENFMNISQLRKNNLTLTFEKPDHINGEMIAPLLLIPLIENAFKYVSDEKDLENNINIVIQLDQNQLDLKVQNTRAPQKTIGATDLSIGGIGLNNVTRRLELLYPNQHHLEISETTNQYAVDLQLTLI